MNKADLIQEVITNTGMSRMQANTIIDSITGNIITTLKKGGRVTLVGFGTFSVATRSTRNGRNPNTGAVIKIKGHKFPRFKAGKPFAEAIE